MRAQVGCAFFVGLKFGKFGDQSKTGNVPRKKEGRAGCCDDESLIGIEGEAYQVGAADYPGSLFVRRNTDDAPAAAP